jgi:hypothetical protein
MTAAAAIETLENKWGRDEDEKLAFVRVEDSWVEIDAFVQPDDDYVFLSYDSSSNKWVVTIRCFKSNVSYPYDFKFEAAGFVRRFMRDFEE